MTTVSKALAIATAMRHNNCHVITVARDWYENGKQHWRILYGTELESGFAGGEFPTRSAALDVATAAASMADTVILAYEHGYRNFRWVDVPYFRATGNVRHR